MKKFFYNFALFSFLLIGFSFCLKAMENGNINFQQDKDRVKNALRQINVQDLGNFFYEAKNREDNPPEEIYQQICQENNITKWPSQETFREAYWGEVFYPRTALTLFYEHSSNDYLLTRFDTLWALACSWRFNHPMALYYLIRGIKTKLDQICNCQNNFIKPLYQKALGILENVEGNDAAYLLRASDYFFAHYKGGYHGFDDEKAFDLYSQSHDLESKLQMLIIRKEYSGYPKPDLEEYLKLAETYPKAYVEIANKFAQDDKEKIHFLTLAHEKGYYPALLELGILYQHNKEKKQALACYLAYGDQGYPVGYVYGSNLYVGLVHLYQTYQEKPLDTLNTAIDLLKKAQDLQHPNACYRLGKLYLELYERTQDKNFEEKAFEAFGQACVLGEMGAYGYYNYGNTAIINTLLENIKNILIFLGYHR